MLHWIISMTRDVGVESLNWPPSHSFLPISELSINIYEGIWIMWIGMTQYHFEKSRNSRKVRNGKQQGWKNLPDLKCESLRGLWDKLDVDPAKEVPINNCSVRHGVYRRRSQTEISDVVITTMYYLYDIDIWSFELSTVMMSHCSWKDVTATKDAVAKQVKTKGGGRNLLVNGV